MNLAHIHLLLNHLPTIGFGVALCLYLASFFAGSEPVRRAGLVLFFLMAVLSIPAYLSGNAAEYYICPNSVDLREKLAERFAKPDDACIAGVSESMIGAHEDAALVAMGMMEVTGFFAWLGLWMLRRKTHLANWNVATVLVLSLVTFVFMSMAATKGGEIRHSEIHSADTVVPPEGYEGLVVKIGLVVSGATGVGWLWPAAEALHFVGLCLLFTTVLVVNLRILGMAKSLSFSSVYQLLPLGMLGFGLNLATGMLFFVGKPAMYMSGVFYWKVAFIVLGGINVLYYTSFDEVWTVRSGDDAPFRAKLIAGSAIFVWLGVLYCGHMLPFLGMSF